MPQSDDDYDEVDEDVPHNVNLSANYAALSPTISAHQIYGGKPPPVAEDYEPMDTVPVLVQPAAHKYVNHDPQSPTLPLRFRLTAPPEHGLLPTTLTRSCHKRLC